MLSTNNQKPHFKEQGMKVLVITLVVLVFVGILIGFSYGFPGDTPVQDTKSLIKKVVDATNNRKPEILEQCYSPTFIYHSQSAPVGTETDMIAIYKTSLDSIPDFKATIEDMIAEKDKVAVRMIYEGTSARYNKKFKIVNHWIARIEKGKIVEVWNVSDVQGMLDQLGFKTTPPDVNTPKIQAK
jgi:predicted ester cyclase